MAEGHARGFDNRADQRAFLFSAQGTLAEYKAGFDRAIANGWLELHEWFTRAGEMLFAGC